MTVLEELTQILEQRKNDDPESSYVASLYADGLNKILEKVGEEATEVLIAAKDVGTESSDAAKQHLTDEVADLWFHSMVLLAHLDLNAQQVLDVLQVRFGTSGLVEKANRDA